MIYCLEDDASIRELMIYTLSAAEFEAEGFSCAADFWRAVYDAKRPLPELIFLDIMLPDEDGISVLKKLRSERFTADIPVIMATAKGSEYDKIKGLDLGADDYLAKPFGMMEMVSRARAVLRRTRKSQGSDETSLCVDGIVLDESKHIVTVDDEPIDLTLKEFDLLALFMKNVGRALTREIIFSTVWGEDYAIETRTVDVHIATLRTKLKRAGELIKTVRGVGYKLIDISGE